MPKYNLKSKITSALRKVWGYHPERTKALKRCQIKGEYYTKIAKKSKRPYKAPYHQCEQCCKKTDKIKVDHIKPVVDLKGFQDWQVYIDRMFVESDKLRCICKECHDAKSLVEKEIRKVKRKKQKKKA